MSKRRYWITAATTSIAVLLVAPSYVAWRRIALARRLITYCQGDLSVNRHCIRRVSQLSGINGLRLMFSSPKTVRFIPRNLNDVKAVVRWDRVKYLTINATNLVDADLMPLAAMRELHALQIEGGSSIGGLFLGAMQETDQLEVFALAHSQFSDANAPYLSQMSNLRYLDLSRSLLSDAGMEALRGLGGLEYLDISYTAITSDSLKAIKRMHKLKSLGLSYTDVSGASLERLSLLQALYMLRIEGIDVRASDLRFLADLPKLQRVFCTVSTTDLEEFLAVFTRVAGLQQLLIVSDGPVGDRIRSDYATALSCSVTWYTPPPAQAKSVTHTPQADR